MRTKSNTKKLWISSSLIIMVVAYSGWAILKPLPVIRPTYDANITIKASKPDLRWPAKSQAAVSILDTDILETHGAQTPLPMASTAKVITALMLLDKKPLKSGQTGPTYTITSADNVIYNNYVAQDGSVFPIKTGASINQYQMLQALMLPSANNIADTSAIWAYGSLAKYRVAADKYLKSHGINNTHVGSDASGLSPDSTTTAANLVAIGKLAMKNPVLAEIFSQSSTTNLPSTPLVRNVNTLLGQDGIVGIKTGNSDQAGGVFLGAAKTKVADKDITVVTAVVGSANRPTALAESKLLIQSARKNFETTTIAKKNTKIGSYNAPWGESRIATSKKDIYVMNWKGAEAKALVKLEPLDLGSDSISSGAIATQKTSVSVNQTYPLIINRSFSEPSLWWRITHPF